MIILTPTSTQYHHHTRLTTFWFDRDLHQEARDFFVRGAVAWPEDTRFGHAVLCGQDVDSKDVFCFEELAFMTVDPLVVDDGKVAQKGLGQWFVDMWAKYHCRTFYCHQNPEVHRRYSLQVYQSRTIRPSPELIDVPTVEQLGDSLLREAMLSGKFHGDARSLLRQHVGKHLQNPEGKKPEMGVHALRCLLAGLEHAGYRKPRNPRLEQVEWVGRLAVEGFRSLSF